MAAWEPILTGQLFFLWGEECLSFIFSFSVSFDNYFPLFSFLPLSLLFIPSCLPLNTNMHTHTHKHSLWEMASVFQLACNGPLTRLASGELGPQQMLLWIGRSSAASRLYWIVIRVELTIHDRRSAFVWEGMQLHQVIFIPLFSVGLWQWSKWGNLFKRINKVLLLDNRWSIIHFLDSDVW